MESHVDRLHTEGVADATILNDDEKNLINGLSTEEVDTLINIHKKLGTVAKGRGDARPAFPI
ncbi:MAG: hypothetical protein AAF604_22455 [Acidobacteriota bacterium]